MMLHQKTNSELTASMYALNQRYGELSLWINEADLKIYDMIVKNEQVQVEISRQIELKHAADVERYIVLSDLKKIELEMDRRVCGAV